MWTLGIGLRSSGLAAGLDLLSHLGSPVSPEVKALRRVRAAQGPTLKPRLLLVADFLCSCQFYPLTLVMRHPISQYWWPAHCSRSVSRCWPHLGYTAGTHWLHSAYYGHDLKIVLRGKTGQDLLKWKDSQCTPVQDAGWMVWVTWHCLELPHIYKGGHGSWAH